MSDDRGNRLITRCAHCDTAFRVYEHQLTKRDGQVRCGACGNVFNAYDTLEDEHPDRLRIDGPASLMPRETDVPVGSPVAVRDVDFPLDAGEERASERKERKRRQEQSASSASSASRAEPQPADSKHARDAEGTPGAQSSVTDSSSANAAVDFPLDDGLPSSDSYLSEAGDNYDFGPAVPSRRARALMMLGIVGLALLFVVQSLGWFRHELAGRFPAVAPALAALCEPLGCTVRLPRRAEQLVIETSELQAEPNGILKLTATIRNNASFLQAQPLLEVTLTDAREQPMVRKVLAPSDYLEPAAVADGSIPAKGDLVARVYLDAREASASGYRLLVFYP